MNIFGHNFRLAIWGESHGQQIGISIDGIPAGVPLSAEDFETDLARRRSGARGTTQRQPLPVKRSKIPPGGRKTPGGKTGCDAGRTRSDPLF